MTRSWPVELQQLAAVLHQKASTFLDRVVRQRGFTCEVCGAPVVNGYETCYPCGELRSGLAPIADRVASLVYAVEPGSQTYQVVRNYKGDRPGPDMRFIMLALLILGLRGHTNCLNALSAAPVDGWAVVPSTRGRAMLHDLVTAISTRPDQEVRVRFQGVAGEREFAPEHWVVDIDSPRNHVLVIDDSWVQGAHAESVASALKSAGVQEVSIFTVARVLRSDWRPNRSLINALKGGTFDWKVCPWTEGTCPVG